MNSKIEVSYKTVIFSLVLILLAWVVWHISDIILMLFISVILMSALSPAVDKLEKLKCPRWLAILLIYSLLWSLVGVVIAGLVPSLVDQTAKLIGLLPEAIGKIEFLNDHQLEISQEILTQIGGLPGNILKFTVSLFSNLINVLTTIVFSIYLLLERKNLNFHMENYFTEQTSTRVINLIKAIERRLGSWVRGELVLMLAVGVLSYIGLLILGVEIALPLAIIAGILEIIPNIGPILSAVPAVIVAFSIHPMLALATIALYFLVQFLENHFLVPKIMEKAVGVNPLVSIVALMVGFRFAGPLGAVLAIPIIIVAHSIFSEFSPKRSLGL